MLAKPQPVDALGPHPGQAADRAQNAPHFSLDRVACPVAPWRLSGTVLVVLVNHPGMLAALGDAVQAAPYKAPPRAPVLGVKPRNTWCGDGAAIAVPPQGVLLGASLGLVIGRAAAGVSEADAMDHVAGYLVAVDLQLPVDGSARHYRPAVRQRARDGFCPLGPVVLPAAALVAAVGHPDAHADDLALDIWVDGVQRHAGRTAGRVRGAARLVADVSAFMTLAPGDVLLPGPEPDMPIAHAGQQVRVRIEGVGSLSFDLVAEPGEGA